MTEIRSKVENLLSGLYSPVIVEESGRIAQHYLDSQLTRLSYRPIPESLLGVTNKELMFDPVVTGHDKKPRTGLFQLIGVYSDGIIKGPLNHILARMFTIPRMIRGYIENYPTNAGELAIYTDPLLLQFDPKELGRYYDMYFAQADEQLRDREQLIHRFKLLGEIGEEAARIENAYPAQNSTEAYELFGIFHLFPSNKTVDITATTPGVILPTEADPLRFKDSVVLLKKNLLRPTYFEMLRHSIDLGEGRKRRYSAGKKGTTKNLQDYPTLLPQAKEILSGYLEVRDNFEIRLGKQEEPMKLATLVGDIGVVYSVRDEAEKNKIAHNVTVISPDEAKKYREIFERQWAEGMPITNTDILDELMGEKV